MRSNMIHVLNSKLNENISKPNVSLLVNEIEYLKSYYFLENSIKLSAFLTIFIILVGFIGIK